MARILQRFVTLARRTVSDLLLLPELRWGRTTCSTTSTTSTFHPYEESQVCSAVCSSAIQAAQAMAALGQAGIRGAVAGRRLNEALQNMQNLARADSHQFRNGSREVFCDYQLGVVKELIIKDGEGPDIRITNAKLVIAIEQDTLEHYSGGVVDQSVIINEQTVATITLKKEVAAELFRLIRED